MALRTAILLSLMLGLTASLAYADSPPWAMDAATKEEAMLKTKELIKQRGHSNHRRLGETSSTQASTASESQEKEKQWFEQFKVQFNKTYATAEDEQKAFTNFLKCLDLMEEYNLDESNPFWVGANQFCDLSEDEIKNNILSELNTEEVDDIKDAEDEPMTRKSRMLLDGEVDWRARGKVTSIKYQGGSCGACWAFASNAAVEVSYLISQGLQASSSKVDLSNQQVISCYGQNGCKNGFVERALAGAASKGVTLEKRYPYKAVSGTCNRGIVDNLKPGEYLQLGNPSYTRRRNVGEATLMADVAKGPVLIYWTAERDFMYYRGGIFRPKNNCNGAVNHMLVIVGYVANKYWIVKNSWSTAWGEAGFGRIAMGGFSARGPCNAYTAGFQPSFKFTKTFSSSVI